MTPPELTMPNDYLPPTCRELAFEAVPYIVCEVDLDGYDLALRRADKSRQAVRQPGRAGRGRAVRLRDECRHVSRGPDAGRALRRGRRGASLRSNLADAPGNFFMKPNGVFYVDETGDAGVLDSDRICRQRA